MGEGSPRPGLRDPPIEDYSPRSTRRHGEAWQRAGGDRPRTATRQEVTAATPQEVRAARPTVTLVTRSQTQCYKVPNTCPRALAHADPTHPHHGDSHRHATEAGKEPPRQRPPHTHHTPPATTSRRKSSTAASPSTNSLNPTPNSAASPSPPQVQHQQPRPNPKLRRSPNGTAAQQNKADTHPRQSQGAALLKPPPTEPTGGHAASASASPAHPPRAAAPARSRLSSEDRTTARRYDRHPCQRAPTHPAPEARDPAPGKWRRPHHQRPARNPTPPTPHQPPE